MENFKTRGFESVESTFMVGPYFKTPTLGTQDSAAYDFYATEDIDILPGKTGKIYTNIKAYMLKDEVLILNVRSSIGIKKNLSMCNTQGWIDSDYYSNIDNDGNIIICLKNNGSETAVIEMGDRIAQGMFIKRLPADDITSNTKRVGGVGSTNKT